MALTMETERYSRLLIVEDEMAQLRTLRSIMGGEGFDVIACETATQALTHLESGGVGVAIVDLRLPDLNGTQLLERARQIDSSIRVIINTAFGSFDSARDAVNLGAFAYVEKAGDPAELVRQVHAAFRWHYKQYTHGLESAVADRTRELEQANASLRREIEERRRAEEELSANEQRLRFASRATRDAMYDWDLGTGKSWRNRALQELFVPLGNATTDWWPEAIHPGDRTRIQESLELAFAGDDDRWSGEYRLRRVDGEYAFVMDRGFMVRDEAGRVVRMIGAMTDITDQKQIENDLRQSEERFHQLFEEAPLAYQSLDGRGCVIDANEAWLDLLGYARKEVVGRWFGDLLALPDQEQFGKRFSQFIKADSVRGVEFEMIRRDGSRIVVSIDGRVARDEHGRFKGTHCILQDITQRRQAEEALRQSQERYRSVVEDSPGMICRFAPDGTITFVNDAYCEYFGRGAADLVGERFTSLIPEAEREAVLARVISLTPEASTLTHEHRVMGTEGDVRWQRWTNRALFDEQGWPIAFQSFGEDITEQKRAEEALRAQESLLRNIIEGTDDPVFVKDRQGRYALVNAAGAKEVGRTPEHIIGRLDAELFPPDLAGRLRSADQRILATGRGETYEEVFAQRDGEGRTYLVAKYPRFDADGTVVGIIGVARDITERKQAQLEMERSHREYRGLFEHAHDAILIFRPDDEVVLEVNKRACEMYGFSRSEFIGLSIKTISVDLDHGDELVHETLTTGSIAQGESAHYRADGSPMLMQINATLVEYGGEQAILTINRDISDRKRAEEKLAEYREHLEELVDARTKELEDSRKELARKEKLASIGTLSAGLAHEINNPVGVILLAAHNVLERVRECDEDRVMERSIRHIVENAQRCDRIIKNVLQFGRRERSPKNLGDLGAVIRRAVTIAEVEFAEAPGVITRALSENAPMLPLNELEMEHVFVNLIRNSLEAGAGAIHISLGRAPALGLRVIIRDDGPGIPPEHVDRVFDPFFTTRREQGGTGLGLSIAHGIIRDHGGMIGVTSDAGSGTTFTIDLPLTNMEDRASSHVEAPDC